MPLREEGSAGLGQRLRAVSVDVVDRLVPLAVRVGRGRHGGVRGGGRILREGTHAFDRRIDLDRVDYLNGVVAEIFERLLLRILLAELSRHESKRMKLAAAVVVVDELCAHQGKVVMMEKAGYAFAPVLIDLIILGIRSR